MSLLWSSKRLTVVSPSEPVLVVALIGFDPGETLALETRFAQCEALSAQWRIGPAGRADLWVVNGRTVVAGEGDALDVDGMHFRPGDSPRPVAFSEPVPPTLEARFRFEPDSPASLSAMLLTLGPWLSPRVVQQALVGHLIANAARFTRSTVIHVQDRGRLLAVMNFAGDTGVVTDATPAAIRRADWVLRPATAGFVPSIFHGAPTEEVLWRFATRADHLEVLPARYLRLPVYLRRAPGLTPDEFEPRQAVLLREISHNGRTFAALRSHLGCGEKELRRDLAALYLVQAITCDPMRSARSARMQRMLHAKGAYEPSATGSSAFDGPPHRPQQRAGDAARP